MLCKTNTVGAIIWQRAFVFLAGACALSGCGDYQSTVDINRPGFARRIYVDADGNSHAYAIFVPYRNVPGEHLPVLMFFNGVGQNGEDGVTQISRNLGPTVWDMRDHFPFLVVAPQCRVDGSWAVGSDDSKWAMEILHSVIQEFNADQDRIYLTGVSSGGYGAWSIATAHADQFAAMVALCGVSGNAQQLAQVRMPIWYFVNQGDGTTLVNEGRQMRKELLRAGLSPRFTEFPRDGHDCWTLAYNMPEMYQWLLKQNRAKNQSAILFDYYPGERLVKEWRQEGKAKWTMDAEESLIANANGGSGRLVSPPLPLPAEFDGEFLLDDKGACEIGIEFATSPSISQAMHFRMEPRSLGTGRAFWVGDEASAKALSPSSQESLRTNEWNDLRIRIDGRRIELEVNGWPAAEFPLGKEFSRAITRCFLVAQQDSEIRWRDFRLRTAKEQSSLSHGDSP